MTINKQNFGCLLPNEQVIIEDGLKQVIDIKPGDKVLGHDGNYHTVQKVFTFNKPVWYISLVNGEHIECSNTHRFLINKSKIDKEISWKTVEELHEGDEIIVMSIVNETGNIKFNKVKINRMFKSGTDNVVYDLTITDSLTYISANGIVNHSF